MARSSTPARSSTGSRRSGRPSLDEIAKNEERYGGRYIETEDVEDAVVNADFIYTDLWWWFGQEAEIPTGSRPSNRATR